MHLKDTVKLVVLFPIILLKNSYTGITHASQKSTLEPDSLLPLQPALVKSALNSVIVGTVVKSCILLASRNSLSSLLGSKHTPVIIDCPGALSSYTGTDFCVCTALCENCGSCADTKTSCDCLDGLENRYSCLLENGVEEDVSAVKKSDKRPEKHCKKSFDNLKIALCENDSCGKLFQTSSSCSPRSCSSTFSF